MDEITTRMYIFNGFLDSGKTTFLKETIFETDFCDNEVSVLIVSEEGEVEYDKLDCELHDCALIYVDNESDISYQLLCDIERKYHPTQVFIELNGMYDTNNIIAMDKPEGWDIVQILTTINAQTFSLYVNNMRSIVYTQVVNSDLVLFNRMDDTMKKSFFRNTIKAINGICQIIYENVDGSLNENEDEELPYDTTSDYLEVLDHDFGIFCYDTLDHPETYKDKTLKIRGKYMGQDSLIKNGFVLAREAMVCCEQDTSLIGMICVHPSSSQLIPGEWLELEGRVGLQYDPDYEDDICVLYVTDLKVIPPLKNEYVTFD